MPEKKQSFNKLHNKRAIGLYLRGDFLSALPKKDTIAIFQVIRIINSLEFWLRLLLKIKKERSDVFAYRNRIEIYFAMICSYKESIKEFSNNLFNDFLKMNLPEIILRKISVYNDRLKNWKQDEYLVLVAERHKHNPEIAIRS